MSHPQAAYTSCVRQLFALEPPDLEWDKGFYLQLGITSQQIEELSRLAVDKACLADTDHSAWAMVHAWRALADLDVPEVEQPLLQVLQQLSDDGALWEWVIEEIPLMLGQMGPRVLPGLAQFLADSQQPDSARECTVTAVTNVYEHFPDSRADCVAICARELEQFAQNPPELNGFLVMALVADLKAVEAVGVIEQAFAAGRVDEDFIGDWNEAQVYLGLKQRSEVPPWRSKSRLAWSLPEPEGFAWGAGDRVGSSAKAANKRKIQKESRRKNRTKKKKKK